MYTLLSVYHRDGGREQAIRWHAWRRTRSTGARSTKVYPDTSGARPVPGISAGRSVYHGRITLLRSAVRCLVRRWVRSYAVAAAAAGDGRQWQPVAGHLRSSWRVVLWCHALLLFSLLVLQSSLRSHRFCSCQWVDVSNSSRTSLMCFLLIRHTIMSYIFCVFLCFRHQKVSTKALRFRAVRPTHSLAPTDDMIRFWRSKVKVTAAIKVAKASASTLRRRCPYSSLFYLFIIM